MILCKGPFLYARIACEIALKDSKRVAIYNDVLANFDATWEGNGLLYHRLDSKTILDIQCWLIYMRGSVHIL